MPENVEDWFNFQDHGVNLDVETQPHFEFQPYQSRAGLATIDEEHGPDWYDEHDEYLAPEKWHSNHQGEMTMKS